MRLLLTIARFFGIALAVLVAGVVLSIGWAALRSSMPFVLASDIELTRPPEAATCGRRFCETRSSRRVTCSTPGE